VDPVALPPKDKRNHVIKYGQKYKWLSRVSVRKQFAGKELSRFDNKCGNIFHVVRFEVFTTVTMKNGVFWDVTPFGFCKNRRFGGT
jgi:hypothetical protein